MILQNTNLVHTPLLSWELYLLESSRSIQWYLGGWEVLGPDTHSELPGVHLSTFVPLESPSRWHRPRHCAFDTGERSWKSVKTCLKPRLGLLIAADAGGSATGFKFTNPTKEHLYYWKSFCSSHLVHQIDNPPYFLRLFKTFVTFPGKAAWSRYWNVTY